jgi:protein SCO1/2
MGARSRARSFAVALISALAAFGAAFDALAAGEPPDEAAALAASQGAIGRELGEYLLSDQSGRPLPFSSLRGKPLVLSIVYTTCYHVCSGLTTHLRDVVKVALQALGGDSFSVLTVGFDTANDTPERMRMYARERGADLPGWHFASADAATIARLTRDAGFTYSPSIQGFDHITQTTVVDARGRVVLQIYGQDFKAPLLVEPLKKLVWGGELDRGTLDGLVRTVKLFCTIYDPASGRYRFDYSLIVNVIAGVLALGMVAIAIVRAARNVH